MYSGDDSIPNCTKPYESSRVNATLLAQVPSSVHQSMSTKSDGYAIFYPSIGHVNDNASTLKKQKLAMHINTRHMASYHPNSTVQHYQHDTLASIQGFTNQSWTRTNQSESTLETNSMENAAFTPKEMNVSSQNVGANVQSTNSPVFGQNDSNIPLDTNTSTLSTVNTFTHTLDGQGSTNVDACNKAKSIFYTRQNKPYNIFLLGPSKKPPIIPSNTILPTPHSNSGIDVAASNSRGMVSHMDTSLNAAQAKSLKIVQRWTNAIRYICSVRKQLWEYELFGDVPTFTADPSDLLKLLKEIDQQKNQVTRQEEHATGLIQAISKVHDICDNSMDEESIRLAEKILDNLFQRFHNMRFDGGSG